MVLIWFHWFNILVKMYEKYLKQNSTIILQIELKLHILCVVREGEKAMQYPP